MLDRPKHLPFATYEGEGVKLPAGELPQTRFDAWLTQLAATPRFCERHRRTRLVLEEKETRYRPVYEEHQAWDAEWKAKPDEFNFRAGFNCPACRVAYALCPPEFHETSFDSFDTSTPERAFTLAKAREFAALVNTHGCGFALFVGPTGPGKTRLACNIIRELNDRDALYVRLGELTRALRSTYVERPAEYDHYGRLIEPKHPLEITQRVRFLVLDEIGCTALAKRLRSCCSTSCSSTVTRSASLRF